MVCISPVYTRVAKGTPFETTHSLIVTPCIMPAYQPANSMYHARGRGQFLRISVICISYHMGFDVSARHISPRAHVSARAIARDDTFGPRAYVTGRYVKSHVITYISLISYDKKHIIVIK